MGRSLLDLLGKNAYTDFLRKFSSSCNSLTEITATRAPCSKSVVRSFPLDEDVDKSLHKYALQEGISINSLVNRGSEDMFSGTLTLPGSAASP